MDPLDTVQLLEESRWVLSKELSLQCEIFCTRPSLFEARLHYDVQSYFNLGQNDAALKAWAARTGNPQFLMNLCAMIYNDRIQMNMPGEWRHDVWKSVNMLLYQ